MYSFQDIIKNKFLEEFNAISVEQLLTALLLTFGLCLVIAAVYLVTFSGALFSRSFAVSLVLLGTVTSLVILAVSSNVVLSLGMVGALSIVRFRTAVKDPLDTVFMFWAIATGIVAGAGYVTIPVLSTLLIGLLFILLSLGGKLGHRRSWLLVIRCDPAKPEAGDAAERLLPRCRVRSRSLRDEENEFIYQARLTPAQLKKAEGIRALDGVRELSIVPYTETAAL